MARCIDCLHFEVCKQRMEELCKWTKVEDLIHNCSKFKDRTSCVEVVRCKNCKYCKVQYPEKQIGKETTPGWYCKEHKSYRRPDDFCSYGERRETDE